MGCRVVEYDVVAVPREYWTHEVRQGGTLCELCTCIGQRRCGDAACREGRCKGVRPGPGHRLHSEELFRSTDYIALTIEAPVHIWSSAATHVHCADSRFWHRSLRFRS